MSASQEEILTNHTTSTLITKHQPTNSSYCINHQAAILKGEYDSMGYERALFTEIVASEKREKSKGPPYYGSLPEDNLAKLHKMTDEKRCNSLKDSLYPTKKAFTKVDETVQSLLSQLEIHGAGVSTEDANQKFLRSLPSAWSQVSLIMRTKPGIDEYDLEEMDLKWQVAMISMRMKKFYKKTGRKLQFDAKEPVGFDKTKVECYNCHKTGHFARECRIKGTQDNRRRDAWNSGNKDGSRTVQKEDSKALVTIDGEGVDWTNHSEDEDYALMACNSSDSDTEVISCTNKCKESYANLKKLYDAQREQLSDASIEIKAYSQGLKKVEAQLVAHQQGANYGMNIMIKFMKIDLDDKTDVLTYHKKLLAEAQKEKEDLKAKVEKWHNSSKNLGKLLNTQMSANDKFGLGYGDHRYDGILSYENEVLQSVFMNKESEIENQPLYDRFVTAEGMHAVPPPMTGNYMPSGPDVEIDDSKFTYGPKQTQPSESESQSSEFDTCESNISAEPSELVSEPVVNESKVECQPKVWPDAPIIEEYESDSEDECVVWKLVDSLLEAMWDTRIGDSLEQESATQATQTPTSTIFGDDETIAKVLLNMSQAKAVSREKEKGVELKDIEEADRPRPTSTRSLLTLKPLPKIDPKDKGKKKIEEKDESKSEYDGIPEAETCLNRLLEVMIDGGRENAGKSGKARIEADRLLAEKLQEQEREQFTIEERAKFLHDTIAAQRRFLAQQRSEAIRNRPPTKNQLRNQMMTYLKHVGNFKHAELKIKKFEEMKLIKRMNEKELIPLRVKVLKDERKDEVQKRVR
ncbi:ribonuclease H-like domain-containing protein [Tanacetum coccineum]